MKPGLAESTSLDTVGAAKEFGQVFLVTTSENTGMPMELLNQ
jgi:hypothetical protein